MQGAAWSCMVHCVLDDDRQLGVSDPNLFQPFRPRLATLPVVKERSI